MKFLPSGVRTPWSMTSHSLTFSTLKLSWKVPYDILESEWFPEFSLVKTALIFKDYSDRKTGVGFLALKRVPLPEFDFSDFFSDEISWKTSVFQRKEDIARIESWINHDDYHRLQGNCFFAKKIHSKITWFFSHFLFKFSYFLRRNPWRRFFTVFDFYHQKKWKWR